MAAALIVSALACRPAEVVTRVPEDHARLQGLVTVYAYACADLGRPPQSAAELLPVLKDASIEDPQRLLNSTRDGEPFEVVWGLDLTSQYAGSPMPLAYERHGRDGVRLLVTCGGQVRELDEADFESLDWPKDYKPKR